MAGGLSSAAVRLTSPLTCSCGEGTCVLIYASLCIPLFVSSGIAHLQCWRDLWLGKSNQDVRVGEINRFS